MKVIYGSGRLPKKSGAKKVVAVGVFDGVHRGHRLILRRVSLEAKRLGLASAVVTFTAHPSSFFHPRRKISYLTSLEHKLSLIAQEGIDICYCLSFNKSLAAMPPGVFIQKVLMEKVGMVSLYVGEDFVFGRGRAGDERLLSRLAVKYKFRAHVLKHLTIKNRIVSSTLIRELIRKGDLALATLFLGRPVAIFGEVIRGEGRGKQLGFPTANIDPHHEVLLPDGIYAAKTLFRGRLFSSVAYLGTKPTFKARQDKRSIEVFLLSFGERDLYGRKIEVRFLKKIRDDRRFPSEAALISHIKEDIARAKKFL